MIDELVQQESAIKELFKEFLRLEYQKIKIGRIKAKEFLFLFEIFERDKELRVFFPHFGYESFPYPAKLLCGKYLFSIDEERFYCYTDKLEEIDFDIEILVVLRKCVENAIEIRRQIMDDIKGFMQKNKVRELVE